MTTARYPKTAFAQWNDARKGQHDAHMAGWKNHVAETRHVGSWSVYAALKNQAQAINSAHRWFNY